MFCFIGSKNCSQPDSSNNSVIQDNPDGININQAVSSSLLRKRIQKVPSSVSVISENASLLSQVKVAKVLFIPFLIFGQFWRQNYENTKILRNLC